MTQAEKRYFRRFSDLQSPGSPPAYMDLYDLILSMDRKSFEESPQINNQKFIAQKKRHLYDKVMESLHHFHRDHVLDEQLVTEIRVAEILTDKLLLKQAARHIRKAQKLIDKHHRPEYISRIWRLKNRLIHLGHSSMQNTTESIRKSGEAQQKEVQLSLETEEAYSQLNHVNRTTEMVRDEALQEEIRQLLKPLKITLGGNKLQLARRYYVLALGRYLLGDWKMSLLLFKCELDIWQNARMLRKSAEEAWVRSIGNVLLLSLRQHQFEQVPEWLLLLRDFPGKTLAGAREADFLKHLFTLMHFNAIDDTRQAIRYLQEHQEEVKNLSEDLELRGLMPMERIYWTMEAAKSSLLSGDAKTALRYTNNFLNQLDQQNRRDSWYAAQFLFFVIHLCLGNDDLLEYEWRNLNRIAQDREDLSVSEQNWLGWVGRWLADPSPEGRSANLNILKSYVLEWELLAPSQNRFRMFGLLPCLEQIEANH